MGYEFCWHLAFIKPQDRYGNNLRASCRRMEETGWLRTPRNNQTLHLTVELTSVCWFPNKPNS
ncbi:hypothetical protein AIR33_21505 [Salmonella enterica]|nr:hypothetical protein [Salmonella enterica]EEJ9029290.1 hypothetical protein [Salmonella enterica subsp. enterica]